MDIQTAQAILQLPPNFIAGDIKRQYHKQSLKYHPDRNNSIDATHRFQEINNAYKVLSDANACEFDNIDNIDNIESMSYDDILLNFINSTNANTQFNKDLFKFIKDIIYNSSSFSPSFLNNLSSDVLIICYKFLNLNRSILGIPSHIMSMLNTIMKKTGITNIHIITPNLKDMYDSNILKLNYKEELYLIPLWHSQISFDIDPDEELDINCIPNLPEHMSLDNNNNLHVYIRSKIEGLLDKTSLDVDVNIIELSIPIQSIHIIKYQTIVYEKSGIPKIDEVDIYNNKDRGDIVVHIELY
jgi:hypothetical protein